MSSLLRSTEREFTRTLYLRRVKKEQTYQFQKICSMFQWFLHIFQSVRQRCQLIYIKYSKIRNMESIDSTNAILMNYEKIEAGQITGLIRC